MHQPAGGEGHMKLAGSCKVGSCMQEILQVYKLHDKMVACVELEVACIIIYGINFLVIWLADLQDLVPVTSSFATSFEFFDVFDLNIDPAVLAGLSRRAEVVVKASNYISPHSQDVSRIKEITRNEAEDTPQCRDDAITSSNPIWDSTRNLEKVHRREHARQALKVFGSRTFVTPTKQQRWEFSAEGEEEEGEILIRFFTPFDKKAKYKKLLQSMIDLGAIQQETSLKTYGRILATYGKSSRIMASSAEAVGNGGMKPGMPYDGVPSTRYETGVSSKLNHFIANSHPRCLRSLLATCSTRRRCNGSTTAAPQVHANVLEAKVALQPGDFLREGSTAQGFVRRP
ncbi:hypothetical protein DFH09DRAFT_1077577 [Mycena vulgaris]|nr:hypothetical protein DFH09DRAFT_1077577 [Mycena vulgaris]